MHALSDGETRILRRLGQYQLVEFSLKLYIAGAYAHIKKSLNETIPFDYGYSQVENFPLERLLEVFKRLNRNKELQDRLNGLRTHRNYVAHRALLEMKPAIRELFNLVSGEEKTDIAAAEKEVDECLRLLAGELGLVVPGADNDAASQETPSK